MSDPLADVRAPSPASPALEFDAGSFRDPAGRVFERDSRIFRTVEARLAEDFGWALQSGLIADLIASGQLVRTWEVEPADAAFAASTWKVLEAERIPFIAYPYEWPFAALKTAALFHLDLHLALLARDATLVDASAYNVQFRGARPVFIDILSLRRYREGEVWNGHRQFCEQFLNPLLLGSIFGIPHHAWYRGSVEGIPVREVAAMLKLRHKLSWNVLVHVVMLDRLQRMASNDRVEKRAATMQRRLPKQAFMALLAGLRKAIARLRPAGTGVSQWSAYAKQNTYSGTEAAQKRAFVQDFVKATRAARIVDVGCNTGDYAVAALEAGAASVVGVESDAQTANLAFERAVAEKLDFLPLVVDAANPSPAQGWRSAERKSFAERATFDAVIALAVEHHLAIGRNVPLDQVVDWLVRLAPRGVVEFVPKDDPTIQRMLALRDDVFDQYTPERFEALLVRGARIVRKDLVSSTGRTLYWFDRSAA